MEFERLKRSEELTKNYVQYIQHCFATKKFCDLKIQTDRENGIDCHKFIITSFFPQLKELLEQADHDDVIYLPEFDQAKVDQLIRDIYSNLCHKNVEISADFNLVQTLKFDKPFDFEVIKQEIPTDHLMTVIKTEGGDNETDEFNCDSADGDLDDAYEDADYQDEDTAPYVDEEDQVLKPKRRGRRKRVNGGHHQIDLDDDDDEEPPTKRKRGRKPKPKPEDIEDAEDMPLKKERKERIRREKKEDREKRPRKSGIRVSKYELFGASKEEKFPPKFLQSNLNKEKTALQKAVEEFHCTCEPKPFKSYRAKERHYQLVHNADKYLECDLCEAVIVKDNFDEHKKACLEKQKANLCPHCGRQFSTASAVSNHVIYVHNIYSCKKCDVTIRGYSKYRRHHLSVHTDPWHCDQCTAVFSEEAKLKDHFLRVHLPDDQKPCVCEICGKGFLYKDKLNTHMMNKHIRARPYPCRFGCDISYNDRSTRSAHEKKKHGASFRDVQANAAAAQIGSGGGVAGPHI